MNIQFQLPSLADQLKGNPQKALKEKAEETIEKIKQGLIEPEQEAQNKIDLLVQLLNFFIVNGPENCCIFSAANEWS